MSWRIACRIFPPRTLVAIIYYQQYVQHSPPQSDGDARRLSTQVAPCAMISLAGLRHPLQFIEHNRVVRSQIRSMYLYPGSRWSLHCHLSYFCLLLAQVLTANATIYCSHRAFGRPSIESCKAALEAIPMDTANRYFVEQQLRTFPPGSDWPPFVDSRPPAEQELVVQMPKFWSYSLFSLRSRLSNTDRILKGPVTSHSSCSAKALIQSP